MPGQHRGREQAPCSRPKSANAAALAPSLCPSSTIRTGEIALIILDVRKDDFWPFILLVFEVEGRGGQEDRRAVEIARHGRRVRVNKHVAFGRTLRRDPAREFKPTYLESHAQSIFSLEPLGEDIELQGADDAGDRARSVVRQE